MRLFRVVVLLTAAAIIVFSAGIALGHPPANAVRALPDMVERGETFNITVNFTAPADNFSAIALEDFAPAGWNVTGALGTPSPATETFTGNEVGFMWWQHPYSNGTSFTALYEVKVPCNASLTNYTFDEDNYSYLVYVIGNQTQIWEDITGDSNVTVVAPAICFESDPFYSGLGQNPQNETLELWSSTPCMLNWNITEIDADWLGAYPTNGSCTDAHVSVNLSANTSGLSLGNYTANITIESPDADNSPLIVPITLYITEYGVLEGNVTFLGRGAPGSDKWIESFEVKLFEPGNLPNVMWAGNSTTDNTGVFTVTGVVARTYDIGIKNWTGLSVLATNVTLIAGVSTPVDLGEIRQGDCKNDDDEVSLQDRILMYALWGTSDFRGDLKRDGDVGLTDRILMYTFWGQSGDLEGQGGFVQ